MAHGQAVSPTASAPIARSTAIPSEVRRPDASAISVKSSRLSRPGATPRERKYSALASTCDSIA